MGISQKDVELRIKITAEDIGRMDDVIAKLRVIKAEAEGASASLGRVLGGAGAASAAATGGGHGGVARTLRGVIPSTYVPEQLFGPGPRWDFQLTSGMYAPPPPLPFQYQMRGSDVAPPPMPFMPMQSSYLPMGGLAEMYERTGVPFGTPAATGYMARRMVPSEAFSGKAMYGNLGGINVVLAAMLSQGDNAYERIGSAATNYTMLNVMRLSAEKRLGGDIFSGAWTPGGALSMGGMAIGAAYTGYEFGQKFRSEYSDYLPTAKMRRTARAEVAEMDYQKRYLAQNEALGAWNAGMNRFRQSSISAVREQEGMMRLSANDAASALTYQQNITDLSGQSSLALIGSRPEQRSGIIQKEMSAIAGSMGPVVGGSPFQIESARRILALGQTLRESDAQRIAGNRELNANTFADFGMLPARSQQRINYAAGLMNAAVANNDSTALVNLANSGYAGEMRTAVNIMPNQEDRDKIIAMLGKIGRGSATNIRPADQTGTIDQNALGLAEGKARSAILNASDILFKDAQKALGDQLSASSAEFATAIEDAMRKGSTSFTDALQNIDWEALFTKNTGQRKPGEANKHLSIVKPQLSDPQNFLQDPGVAGEIAW